MSEGRASIEELGRRLQTAIEELAAGSTSGRWRGLLNDLLWQVWSLAGKMDTGAANRGLEALRPARRIARRFAAPEESPLIQAARSLEETQAMLLVAAAAAKPTELLLTLRTRSPTTMAVVDILGRERRFLKRKEISLHLRQRELSISPQRVSQILVQLYEDGFLMRQFGRGQGAHEVAYYALSDQGRAVWQEASAPSPTITPREAELEAKLRARDAEIERLKTELLDRNSEVTEYRIGLRQPIHVRGKDLPQEMLWVSDSDFDPGEKDTIGIETEMIYAAAEFSD